MDLIEISLIDRAKDLAMDVHSHQYRKVSNKPYYLHSFRVYQSAIKNGLSKNEQILALLHDTYENSINKNYVKDKIQSNFGDKMLKLVLIISHDKSVVDYDNYLLQLSKLSRLALNVKLLDIIENLKDNASKQQKNKYKTGLLYLLNSNVNINIQIINKINNLTK